MVFQYICLVGRQPVLNVLMIFETVGDCRGALFQSSLKRPAIMVNQSWDIASTPHSFRYADCVASFIIRRAKEVGISPVHDEYTMIFRKCIGIVPHTSRAETGTSQSAITVDRPWIDNQSAHRGAAYSSTDSGTCDPWTGLCRAALCHQLAVARDAQRRFSREPDSGTVMSAADIVFTYQYHIDISRNNVHSIVVLTVITPYIREIDIQVVKGNDQRLVFTSANYLQCICSSWWSCKNVWAGTLGKHISDGISILCNPDIPLTDIDSDIFITLYRGECRIRRRCWRCDDIGKRAGFWVSTLAVSLRSYLDIALHKIKIFIFGKGQHSAT